MRTATLTKTVLMIIWVIWFGTNGIDTKAHEWGVGETGGGGEMGRWGRQGGQGKRLKVKGKRNKFNLSPFPLTLSPCPVWPMPIDMAHLNSSVFAG
jgi:hypothetical protein